MIFKNNRKLHPTIIFLTVNWVEAVVFSYLQEHYDYSILNDIGGEIELSLKSRREKREI